MTGQLSFSDIPLQDNMIREMTVYLLNEGKIAKDEFGYYWTDCDANIGERPSRILRQCPNCGQRHEEEIQNCDMVWWRQGWHKVYECGSYDG